MTKLKFNNNNNNNLIIIIIIIVIVIMLKQMFSDIGSEWGLRKCVAVKRGKIIQEQTQMPISHKEFIPLLQNSDHY